MAASKDNASSMSLCCLCGQENSFFDKLMDPKRHVIHTILFVVCACLTFAYWGVSGQSVGGVELSNFQIMKLSDVISKDVIETHDNLLRKWKCTQPNSTAVAFFEPWGPDSMCRCIRMKTCTGIKCQEIEKDCFEAVVPSYAQVYAGYDSSYWNILIAFFYLHIGVMLNMYIETKEDEIKQNIDTDNIISIYNADENGTTNSMSDNDSYTSSPASRQPQQAPAKTPEKNNVDRDTTDARQKKGRNDRKFENNRRFGNDRLMKSNLGYIYLGDGEGQKNGTTQGASSNAEEDNNGAELSRGDRFLNFLQNKTLRLFILTALSLICTVLSWNLLFGVKIGNRQTDQMCTGETCMTEMLISVVTIALSTIDVILFFVYAIEKYVIHNIKFGFSIFAMTVWEDLHNTVAFMLLVSSFSTMSGVHDDTTIFFDVTTVAFIGFLQSIQHIIMLQREEIISYCTDNGMVIKDTFQREHTVERTILSYFLYTRLFLFLVIIVTVFVFIQRLEPSIVSSGWSENWNYYLRNATLILSLMPSVIADIGYELNHIKNMKTTGMYSAYVGAHVWRRAVFLSAMIAYIVVSLKTYEKDNSAMIL